MISELSILIDLGQLFGLMRLPPFWRSEITSLQAGQKVFSELSILIDLGQLLGMMRPPARFDPRAYSLGRGVRELG